MRIFTIGYEATTMAELLAALRRAGVERVIDVRALPLSRRPGFSKSPLRAALTGKTTSPGIFDVLVLLGQDESLARIADQMLEPNA